MERHYSTASGTWRQQTWVSIGSFSVRKRDVDLHERGPIAIEARLHIQLGLGFKGAGFGVEGAGFGV